MDFTVQTIYQKSTAKTFHTHPTAQLSFTVEGIMYVTAENNLFIVPSNMSIFIPKNTSHKSEMLKNLTIASLYFPDQYTRKLPRTTQLIPLTELAKALILKICALNNKKPEETRVKGLISMLIDELDHVKPIHYANLALPNNRLVLKVYQLFRVAKGQYPSIEETATSLHVSGRTLLRIFKKETGISFMIWKQQFLFIKALELLEKYKRTSIVAYKLGYNSESAFISMFKRMSGGKVPSEFHTKQYSGISKE